MSVDRIVREDHPFDRGYWARFDGKRRPSGAEQRKGWDTCNAELRFEQNPPKDDD